MVQHLNNERLLTVEWLGQLEYAAALARQQQLVQERIIHPTAPDTLLLLEHPPTYTLGKRGNPAHLLLDRTTLTRQGFAVHEVERGGDITYHGPGQLVGYPILHLKRLYATIDLHAYVHDVEAALIRALADVGVTGWRYTGYTGVWVDTAAGPRKIAAIGIRVNRQGISSHGFALNVNPNLQHFEHIIPCGIREHGVISLAALLAAPLTVQDVLTPVMTAFRAVFQKSAPPPS